MVTMTKFLKTIPTEMQFFMDINYPNVNANGILKVYPIADTNEKTVIYNDEHYILMNFIDDEYCFFKTTDFVCSYIYRVKNISPDNWEFVSAWVTEGVLILDFK